MDAINGMEYLHAQSFIHGSLTARNILIQKHGAHYTAHISDYGLNLVQDGEGPNFEKVGYQS